MAFWRLVSADDFLESLRIPFIIAVTGHRCKPGSCTFEASNAEYGTRPYSASAQWLNGMSFAVSSLLIPIQLCGGKKTKHSKYNNVFRVFLSFSLTFDAIPRYCDYKIRKLLRNHLCRNLTELSLFLPLHNGFGFASCSFCVHGYFEHFQEADPLETRKL